MSGKYDDIINLPHHVSLRHAPMPRQSRAAQFAPFAALVGYGDVIEETARLTERRIELDENAKAQLDLEFRRIIEKIKEKPIVTICYFEPDSEKEGGREVTVTSRLVKINLNQRYLFLKNGDKIALDDIYYIGCDDNRFSQPAE